MKRRIIFLAVFVFYISGTSAQIAYYDAIKLKSYLNSSHKFKGDDSSKKAYFSVLSNYVVGLKPGSAFDDVQTAFESNPFFDSLGLKELTVDASTDLSPTRLLTSIGNLNVTNTADGLARFLIKRGKEELNVAVFNRMKSFLDKHEECKTLFPATTDFLGKIAAYRYAELIQSLREAFYKDLSNLIINLNQLIDLPKYQTLLKSLPEIRVAVRSAKIVSELSQSDSTIFPDSIIHQFASLDEWTEINVNLGGSWKLLDLLSQSVRDSSSIRDPANGRRWIKLSDLNALVQDKMALRIFVGLLYQKSAVIKFRINKKDSPVQDFMRQNVSSIFVVSSLVENFAILANDVDRTVKDIKNKQPGHTITPDDYYTYIGKAINIIEYGFKVANAIQPGIVDDKYIMMARNSNDLYKNVYTKNFNSAAVNAYNILDLALNHSKELAKEKADLLPNGDAQVAALNEIIKTDRFSKPRVVEAVLKYGNVMASIIKAESAEEVQAAVEAAALPAGSSSIKKNAAFNIALNAYIGYYTGPKLNKMSDVWNNNKGITAPIGITVSKCLGKVHNFNLGSISGYGTLFNIGSIVSYRLNNDSSAIKQEIKLENIFSPGGYLVYGLFANVPVSVGYGWQYGPRLFKVDADKLNLTDKPRWRHNWFFAIDIPLANFYTKSKFKRNQ